MAEERMGHGIVGLIASTSSARLNECLSYVTKYSTIRIHCLCQGMTDGERVALMLRNKSDLISFTFIDKILELDVVFARNKLYEMFRHFDCVYFFDDDFEFTNQSFGKIVAYSDHLMEHTLIGAVSFNRANGPRLVEGSASLTPVVDSRIGVHFLFDPAHSFSPLWTNGGMLIKTSSFQGYDPVGTFLFGDDIGLFMDIYFAGYDIIVTELDVNHYAGEMEGFYLSLLERKFASQSMEDFIDRNIHLYGSRGFTIYKYLMHKNYISKFIDREMAYQDDLNCGRTFITDRGKEHRRMMRARLLTRELVPV